ncbi:MAG: flavodoxin [Candidatus Limnocylindrales bacterium]
MRAVVVYESLWGNTAAVARAIAEGIGPDARALTTDEATATVLEGADLVVAGAPVIAFGLLSESMRARLASDQGDAPARPDLTHPSLRGWLAGLPAAHGRAAAFETGLRWSPGGAKGAIMRGLEGAGYAPVGKAARFIVQGKYGPLREGELVKASAWGAALAQAMG